MNQLRADLLDRIKDKHDLWFHDSMELYKMADLKPSQACNDAITVMTYQIVRLLDHYDSDLNQFIKGMRSTLKFFRQATKS